MAMPITHFMIGVTVIALILSFLTFFFNRPLRKTDIWLLILGGLFALIPDIPAIWGNFYWDENPILNIFFFHYWLDRIETDNVLAIDILSMICGGLSIIVYLILHFDFKKNKSKRMG
jgi:hypothetical protein